MSREIVEKFCDFVWMKVVRDALGRDAAEKIVGAEIERLLAQEREEVREMGLVVLKAAHLNVGHDDYSKSEIVWRKAYNAGLTDSEAAIRQLDLTKDLVAKGETT